LMKIGPRAARVEPGVVAAGAPTAARVETETSKRVSPMKPAKLDASRITKRFAGRHIMVAVVRGGKGCAHCSTTIAPRLMRRRVSPVTLAHAPYLFPAGIHADPPFREPGVSANPTPTRRNFPLPYPLIGLPGSLADRPTSAR